MTDGPHLLALFPTSTQNDWPAFGDAGFEVFHVPNQAAWEEALAMLPGLWERHDEPYAVFANPPATHLDPVLEGLAGIDRPWVALCGILYSNIDITQGARPAEIAQALLGALGGGEDDLPSVADP